MTVEERRREAEFVANTAKEAERRVARLRARERELLGDAHEDDKCKFLASFTPLLITNAIHALPTRVYHERLLISLVTACHPLRRREY